MKENRMVCVLKLNTGLFFLQNDVERVRYPIQQATDLCVSSYNLKYCIQYTILLWKDAHPYENMDLVQSRKVNR